MPGAHARVPRVRAGGGVGEEVEITCRGLARAPRPTGSPPYSGGGSWGGCAVLLLFGEVFHMGTITCHNRRGEWFLVVVQCKCRLLS